MWSNFGNAISLKKNVTQGVFPKPLVSKHQFTPPISVKSDLEKFSVQIIWLFEDVFDGWSFMQLSTLVFNTWSLSHVPGPVKMADCLKLKFLILSCPLQPIRSNG